MPDTPKRRTPTQFASDIRVPFTYTVVHGRDPSRKSKSQRAQTRSMNLMGLSFDTPVIEVDELHLSFTEGSFGRNSLEIVLDLGKKIGEVEVLGQVEWYESRSTPAGHYFIIGVGFMDVQADVVAALREFLMQAQGFV
jgi:hypothetical protein